MGAAGVSGIQIAHEVIPALQMCVANPAAVTRPVMMRLQQDQQEGMKSPELFQQKGLRMSSLQTKLQYHSSAKINPEMDLPLVRAKIQF